MSKKVQILLALVALLTLTACLPEVPKRPGDSKPPQGKDWFGNPLPTEAPTCPIIDQPEMVPPPPANPNMKTAIVKIEVFIIGSKAHEFGGSDHMCLPVGLHVYGTVAGQPGIKIDDGTPGGKTLPWTGIRNTPWSASFLVGYDTTKVLSPVVNVDFIATYSPMHNIDDGSFAKAGIVQMDCNVRINGRSQKSWLGPKSTVTLTGQSTQTVRCNFSISV